MTPLPIDPILSNVIDTLRRRRALVLVAPPGSGKTTRLAPAILRSDLLKKENGGIVLLQPRRVAARAAAQRIADENGWRLGEEVGYRIRFENRCGPRTRLNVMTEGILNRRLVADPFLEGIGAVILDEFHERSLHTDLAVAMLKEIRETVREDLFLIVMSATLDAEPIARFLGDCPILRAEGRAYPVILSYRPAMKPAFADAIAEVLNEVVEHRDDSGHVLVFLPGAEEIRRASIRLKGLAERKDLSVIPLHGGLASDEQDRALRPSDRRKIILATNIAETSLTIDGVSTVIDSGLARVASYDPARGLDRLELQRISKASAAQRAGRAGRTGPGRCIRLWSEGEQRGLPELDQPEVARVDLASTLLDLHAWGATDPERFGWFEPPLAERLASAEELLVMLGAIDEERRLTPIGRRLLEIPAHPRLARLLLAAAEAGHPREGATLAALLSEKDVLLRGPAKGGRGVDKARQGRSDLLTRLDLFDEAERSRFSPELGDRGIDPNAARQVGRIRDQLERIARRIPSRQRNVPFDEEMMLRWVLLAYPDRVTRRRGAQSTGVMVGGRGVVLDRDSVVRDAEFFLSIDPREDRRGPGSALQAHVRIASAIELGWLEASFPESVRAERSTQFDAERRRAVGIVSLRYRDLVLREDRNARVEPAEASKVLASALGGRAETFVRENEEASAWLARLDLVRRLMPESDWPDFDAARFEEIVAEACLGKSSEDEARRAPWVSLLQSQLSYSQTRILQEHAPETITVPTGNRIRLSYQPGKSPILAVRIQELFGLRQTPRIAGGRQAVVLHLLGPNYRPVQITDDLRSFWENTYAQVRKDLRGRYPKHAWPEDPLNAAPEAKGSRGC